MLTLKKVTRDFAEMPKVETLAKEAFPPEEYLAPEEILDMAGNAPIDFWAIYDATHFVGFMVVATHETTAYLFFLAIRSECRSRGYGGKALALFCEQYPQHQHVVDLEKPDSAAENAEQRATRKRFYLRNGYRETGQFLNYLGIDFEVLCLEENFNLDAFKALLKNLPVSGFKPRFFSKNDACTL